MAPPVRGRVDRVGVRHRQGGVSHAARRKQCWTADVVDRDGKATGAIEAPTTDDAKNLNAVISPTNDSLIAANWLEPQTGTWNVRLIRRVAQQRGDKTLRRFRTDVYRVVARRKRDSTLRARRCAGILSAGDCRRRPQRVLDVSGFTDSIPSDWSDGYLLFQQTEQSIGASSCVSAPIRLADRQPQLDGFTSRRTESGW